MENESIYKNEHWLGIVTLVGILLGVFGFFSAINYSRNDSGIAMLVLGLFVIHFSQAKSMENRLKFLEDQARANSQAEPEQN